MRAIFISYRRDDAEGQAGRLFDDLTEQFGSDTVFMDVAAIEPGRDFRRAIDDQVSSCGVMLAIIGRSWLTAKSESGSRRLDDPADFVRLETASALKRNIPVVPVLVQGARIPRAEDLPEDLKELAFRNSVELTHVRWDSDVQVLVKALRPYVQPTQEPTGPAPGSAPSVSTPTRSGLTKIMAALSVGVLVLVLGGYVLNQQSTKDEVTEPTASTSTQRIVEETAAPSDAMSSPPKVDKVKPKAEAERRNEEQIAADDTAAGRSRRDRPPQSLANPSGATPANNKSAAPRVSMNFPRNSRATNDFPSGHRLIGKWYNSLGEARTFSSLLPVLSFP